MNLRRATQCAATIAVLGLGATDAHAEVIDYSFSVAVDASTFTAVPVGETFTISYSVDTAIPPSGWFTIGSMTLADFNNVSDMKMTAGSFSATGSGSLLRQIDDAGLDQYMVDSGAAVGSSPLDGLDIIFFRVEMLDLTGKAISDALTPLIDPSLDRFSLLQLVAVFASRGDESEYVRALIVRPVIVPEPATLALLGLGLAGVRFAGRRR